MERDYDKCTFGKTSGGPRSDPVEAEEFEKEQLINAKAVQQKLTKEELLVQMQAKTNEADNRRIIEMEIDKHHAVQELERIAKEDQAAKEFESMQKEEFKHAWLA